MGTWRESKGLAFLVHEEGLFGDGTRQQGVWSAEW
jgi:hypothetical protein